MEGSFMAGVSGVGGASGVQFEAQLAAKTAKLQKDTMEMQGDMAQKLIQSAVTNPNVGRNLNIQA